MASSASIGYALWMDGSTFNGLLGRQGVAALFPNQLNSAQVIGGVMPTGGELLVTAGSGMSVNVASGYCVIPSGSGSTYGGYLCSAMQGVSGLTIAAADATNPRIDLVCAYVTDNGNSTSEWGVQVITGTPSTNPAAPALPAGAIPLATIQVPSSQTLMQSNLITDARVFMVTHGGIVPVAALVTPLPSLSGYEGMYIHDRSSGRFARYTSENQITQPRLFPFTPAIKLNANNVASTSSEQEICSVTITTDGVTDIEIMARFVGFQVATLTQQFYCNVNVYIDSTLVAQIASPLIDNAVAQVNVAYGGGTIHHITSGAGGDTPSAGTHTVSFGFSPHYDGTHQVVVPGTQSPSLLYVRPVSL